MPDGAAVPTCDDAPEAEPVLEGPVSVTPVLAPAVPATSIVLPAAFVVSLYVVPLSVIAGPPTLKVEEPMTNCVSEFAVRVVPSTVITSGAPVGEEPGVTGIVLPSTITSVLPAEFVVRLNVVPLSVMAGPPMLSVDDPMTNWDCELAVRVVPSNDTIAGPAVG